jgi:hypothetical protein
MAVFKFLEDLNPQVATGEKLQRLLLSGSAA